MFLSEAIDDYAAYSRSELGHTRTTVLTYRSRQRQFAVWLGENGLPDAKIEDVTPQQIRRYTYSLSARDARPRSIRGFMNAIRALYEYLVKMGATTENPGLEVKLPKKDAATRLLVNDEDLEKLLAACDLQAKEFRVARDTALLAVLIFCGLRRQELLDLTVRCVNLDGKFLLIEQGKGGKSRTVYLCEACVRPLRDWLAYRATMKLPHDWLFIAHNHKRLGPTTLMSTIEDVKAIAGLKGNASIKPHSIRHAAATRMMRNGADISSIQAWLGHASLQTTAVYLHTNEEQVRSIAEKAAFASRDAQPQPEQTERAPSRAAEHHRLRRAAR